MKNQKKRSSLAGFTLIEVLVVVLIIGIVVTLARIAWPAPRIKARDIKRVSAVNTVQAALGLYYKDQGFYPTAITAGQALRSPDNRKVYLDEIPYNPTPRTDNSCPDNEFVYTVGTNNQSYSFSACIKNEKTGRNKLIYGTKEAVFHCGDRISDRDGFTYGTISIGNQCWMTENLKTKTNPDGTCINTGMTTAYGGYFYTIGPAPECKIYNNGVITTLGGWGVNQNLASKRDCISPTVDMQGVENDCTNGYTLYTWRGALGDTANNPIIFNTTGRYQQFKRQGICPDGWHIPTSDDFTTLERAICTSGSCITDFPYDLSISGWRGTNESGALKIGGSSGFNSSAAGQRRPNGLSLPSYQSPVTLSGMQLIWVAAYDTGIGTGMAGRRTIDLSLGSQIERKYTDSSSAQITSYGVRCLKD